MLSQGHYEHYKKAIQEKRHNFSKIIEEELNVKNIDFIESDIMELKEKHHKKYDMLFTSEGCYAGLPIYINGRKL